MEGDRYPETQMETKKEKVRGETLGALEMASREWLTEFCKISGYNEQNVFSTWKSYKNDNIEKLKDLKLEQQMDVKYYYMYYMYNLIKTKHLRVVDLKPRNEEEEEMMPYFAPLTGNEQGLYPMYLPPTREIFAKYSAEVIIAQAGNIELPNIEKLHNSGVLDFDVRMGYYPTGCLKERTIEKLAQGGLIPLRKGMVFATKILLCPDCSFGVDFSNLATADIDRYANGIKDEHMKSCPECPYIEFKDFPIRGRLSKIPQSRILTPEKVRIIWKKTPAALRSDIHTFREASKDAQRKIRSISIRIKKRNQRRNPFPENEEEVEKPDEVKKLILELTLEEINDIVEEGILHLVPRLVRKIQSSKQALDVMVETIEGMIEEGLKEGESVKSLKEYVSKRVKINSFLKNIELRFGECGDDKENESLECDPNHEEEIGASCSYKPERLERPPSSTRMLETPKKKNKKIDESRLLRDDDGRRYYYTDSDTIVYVSDDENSIIGDVGFF